jgi:hypothetical protein
MRGAAARPPAPESPRPPRRGITLDAHFPASSARLPPPAHLFSPHGSHVYTWFAARIPLRLEANGARWPSRSSKSAVSRSAGELGSTPRRFRHAPLGRAESLGLRQAGFACGSPNRLNSQTLPPRPVLGRAENRSSEFRICCPAARKRGRDRRGRGRGRRDGSCSGRRG